MDNTDVTPEEWPTYIKYLLDRYPINVEEARLLVLIAWKAYGTTVCKDEDIQTYVWARDRVRENPTQ